MIIKGNGTLFSFAHFAHTPVRGAILAWSTCAQGSHPGKHSTYKITSHQATNQFGSGVTRSKMIQGLKMTVGSGLSMDSITQATE